MQPGLFEDLSSLSKLVLSIPSVSTLDSMVIKPLRALEFLEISNSSLTELPDGMFVGPTALRDVRLIGASSQEFLLPVCLNSAASSEQGKRVYHFSMVHGSPFELTIEYTAEGPLSTDTGHERSIKFKRGSATSEEFFLNDDRTKLVYSWGNSGNDTVCGFDYLFPDMEIDLPNLQDDQVLRICGESEAEGPDNEDDLPTMSLKASSSSVAEGTDAVFTFGISAAIDHDMGVEYSFGPVPSAAGEPLPGRIGGGVVFIPAGSTSQTLEFGTADMVPDEPGSTYSFAVSLMDPGAGAGYQVASAQSSATLTITASTGGGSESSEEGGSGS